MPGRDFRQVLEGIEAKDFLFEQWSGGGTLDPFPADDIALLPAARGEQGVVSAPVGHGSPNEAGYGYRFP